VRLARQGRAETHRLLHFSNAVMCIFRSTLHFFFCLFDTLLYLRSGWFSWLLSFFLLIGGEKAVVLACGLRGDWERGGGVRSCAVLCAEMKEGMDAIKVVVREEQSM
jgi:hypothetical protein